MHQIIDKKMKIKFLKAFNGDSILISFKDNEGINRNILIDGGVRDTYEMNIGAQRKLVDGELKTTIASIRRNGQFIDLLIITHIDDDHIKGILELFNKDANAYKIIKEIWFNSGGLIAESLQAKENEDLKLFINPDKKKLTSIPQGIEFSKYIKAKGIWERKIIIQGDIHSKYGLDFRILSPSKIKLEKLLKEWEKEDPDLKTAAKLNDYSISLKEFVENDKFEEDSAFPNGSSIAFILTYNDKNLLFLGDAHPSIIVEGLQKFEFSPENPLEAELVKISHHGSRGNTSVELLKYLKSRNYIISTNGRKDQHPHKQFLARLINEKNDCNIFFNYPERIDMIFSEQDKNEYQFNAVAITKEFEL